MLTADVLDVGRLPILFVEVTHGVSAQQLKVVVTIIVPIATAVAAEVLHATLISERTKTRQSPESSDPDRPTQGSTLYSTAAECI